ncbi:recombinase family protein [Minwuia thermotolerans]|uniref:recombinase family protein n=1 Tax=Minwuia thermotolerans TaxID=2056226 RepID=UPI001A9C73A6|nr:recombinase family protein [Minwuia thermotolerans]
MAERGRQGGGRSGASQDSNRSTARALVGGRSVRCAIYTRKSTEEGLDQAFNSLDAQREACAAYIRSQQHEGWMELPTHYDDGGFSGGSMDRPALAALLDDIRAGRIDTVVVYKVDRLTRSLADFARIVELFEGQGVSFVSVTQQFNTTTSMGRLTLNVLLSFAQFEREVTAERIRDKIAASKKKGMWMGGAVPIGYRVEDRKLVIDAEAAATVRRIFELYLGLGSVREVKAACDGQGIVTSIRTSRSGRMTGGASFSRGHLYWLLRNPIYIGRVKHRGQTYEGEHEPIIEMAMWAAVQQKLDASARFHIASSAPSDTHLFRKRFVDGAGRPLHATKTSKNGRHYFYYTSRGLMVPGGEKERGWRVPAGQLDTLIIRQLAKALGDPIELARLLDPEDMLGLEPAVIADRSTCIRDVLSRPNDAPARNLLALLVRRIRLLDDGIEIELCRDQLCSGAGEAERSQRGEAWSDRQGSAEQSPTVLLRLPVRLGRRSSGARLLVDASPERQACPDQALIELVARAHRWNRMLGTVEAASIRDIAAREHVEESEISRVIALSCLAPDIIDAILDGLHPPDLTANRLKRMSRLPLDWSAQRRLLGFET